MAVNAIFNGDTLPNRRGTNSVKWDTVTAKFGMEGLLPLWVADMDFPSPDCVRQALQQTVDLGIFAYYAPPPSYQQAFMDWELERHQVTVNPEWLRFSPGVVTGMYWLINALTQPGDGCIILTPCYYPFMDAVRDTGRTIVESSLKHHQGAYTIDFDDLEQKAAMNSTRMLLLCSPHNPVGRVWTAQELERVVSICNRHNVFVVSDEIHQDIVFDSPFVSVLSVGGPTENRIVLTSASKTFNLAGCLNSFVVLPGEEPRCRYDTYAKTLRVRKGSQIGYIATEAAYRHGKKWLTELLPYLRENQRILETALLAALPRIVIAPLEGTFMTWIDLGAYLPASAVEQVVRNHAKLAVDFGSWFFPDSRPDTHIRINIATSRANIEAAANRLVHAVEAYAQAAQAAIR